MFNLHTRELKYREVTIGAQVHRTLVGEGQGWGLNPASQPLASIPAYHAIILCVTYCVIFSQGYYFTAFNPMVNNLETC